VTQREAVHALDGGRCVACGKRWSVTAPSLFGWQAHHVVRAVVLRRRGVRPARIRDATYCVLVCHQPCHERHESAARRIPFERLPQRVVEAVDALGPWAQDTLRSYHPPTPVGTT
jgi:hypothetical protein